MRRVQQKLLFNILLSTGLITIGGAGLGAESIIQKANDLRVNQLKYLRLIRTMAFNFPCIPFPQCQQQRDPGSQDNHTDLIKEYDYINAVYQEGMIYYYEGDYQNAYGRLISAQIKTDKVLEELSQMYIERTRFMLREGLEKKDIEDPDDMTLTNVFAIYGPKSYRRKVLRQDRESPHTERSYNAKESHWVQNRFRLDGNVRKGYEHLSLAKKERLKAFKSVSTKEELKAFSSGTADVNLEPGSAEAQVKPVVRRTKERMITPSQRRQRIEHYLGSIKLCRLAKINAAFLFILKYPYDNYALQNPHGLTEKGRHTEVHKPVIEGVRMNWAYNPYLYLKKLHPVYDLRIPAEFRRDVVDVRQEIYSEEVDRLVRLKLTEKKPKSFEELSGPKAQPPRP